MELYVEKLPENCDKCVLRIRNFEIPFDYCAITKYACCDKDRTCPLKALSNAQIAIGMLQEGKNVEVCFEGGGVDMLHNLTTVEDLLQYHWTMEKP